VAKGRPEPREVAKGRPEPPAVARKPPPPENGKKVWDPDSIYLP
jgi:hypothetical protein